VKKVEQQQQQQCSSLQRTVIFIQCLYTGLNSLLEKNLLFLFAQRIGARKKKKEKY